MFGLQITSEHESFCFGTLTLSAIALKMFGALAV